MFPFKRILLSLPNKTITATKDHYLFVSDPLFPGAWEHRRAVAAQHVKPGDRLWIMGYHQKEAISLADVVLVEDVMAEGLVAPFTESGTMIVDGIIASTYTDLFGSERRMHVFCAWVRKLWHVWPEFLHFMHAHKLSSPTALSVANGVAILLNWISR